MRRLARPIGLLSLAGGLAAATMVIVVAPASAASIPVTFDCQARPPIGPPQQIEPLTTSIQSEAPATAVAGSTFEATLAPDPITVPATAAGYTVNRLANLVLKVPVPQGSTFQSATLTGGSNLGTGTPTVTQADNVVTVTVPGPLAGGSTFQLPVLHLNLTASGEPGTKVETKLAGTSYDDPSMTFVANVQVGVFPIDVPTNCFANPSPTFTSTAIEAAPAP
jgi:dehydratase